MVEDSGPGMSAEDIARACVRFRRGAAGRNKPGAGRLAIVGTIAEILGAKLVLENRTPQPGLRAALVFTLKTPRMLRCVTKITEFERCWKGSILYGCVRGASRAAHGTACKAGMGPRPINFGDATMQTSLKLRLAAATAVGALTCRWAPPRPPPNPAVRSASPRPARRRLRPDLPPGHRGPEAERALKTAMRIVYMPGGIGAVAYNNIVAQHPNEPGTIVAFSGGSLLNLAQGKFGKYNVDNVRWLAGIGTDYGVAVVRNDSPYTDLKGLMEAFKQDPTKIVLAPAAPWAARIDEGRADRQGGGRGLQEDALRGLRRRRRGRDRVARGHIQAYMGDAAEAFTMLEGGAPIRVLAVFNDQRLPGKLNTVPTAREQGYDIVWPIIRGFYVGPKVSDSDYAFWVQAFDRPPARRNSPSCASSRACFLQQDRRRAGRLREAAGEAVRRTGREFRPGQEVI